MQSSLKKQALIVIDMQNDFCPGGALAVSGGDEIIGPINNLMAAFPNIVLTQDWHPSEHSSFASAHKNLAAFSSVSMPYGPQVLWPDHCVQGSHGARLHRGLAQDRAHMILRKGFNPNIDSYSAFFENDHVTPTGLEGYLRAQGVQELVLVGLATDYCVAWSALDAVGLGFEVAIELSACRPIDLDGSLAHALSRLQAAGVDVRT